MSAREPNRVFRESFLAYEFEGERYETMRRFGEILSELAGESSLHPRFTRPIIYPELEAAAVDLAQAAEYLEEASRDAEPEDAAQVKLAGAALGRAEQLRAFVSEIRRAVSPAPDDPDVTAARQLLEEFRPLLAHARRIEAEDPDGLVKPAADFLAQALATLEDAIRERSAGE